MALERLQSVDLLVTQLAQAFFMAGGAVLNSDMGVLAKFLFSLTNLRERKID
jgi:hypothetical protein